jgi:capsular polysaccharide biosynthesis protein
MPARVDWYLTSAKGTAFQRETWAALGIPEKKIVHVDAASHFTLQTALVPNHRLATWNVSRWLVEFLRSLPLREVAAPVRADRIYLSRASESHRRLACEAELVPLLEQRGFVAVECGKLSVAEQKAVFAQAQVIVAPHGAALTNLVFCQPDALVVDLMSAAWPGLFFWGLADACGLRYVCLADAPAARPVAVPDLRRDIEFSPAELLLRLDELLAVHSLTPPAVSGRPS